MHGEQRGIIVFGRVVWISACFAYDNNDGDDNDNNSNTNLTDVLVTAARKRHDGEKIMEKKYARVINHVTMAGGSRRGGDKRARKRTVCRPGID